MTMNWNYALVFVGTQERETFLAEVYYDRENQPTGFIEVGDLNEAERETAYNDVTTAGVVRWFYDNGTFERRKSRSRRRGRRKRYDSLFWYWTPSTDGVGLVRRRQLAVNANFIERLWAQPPQQRRRPVHMIHKKLSPKGFKAARLRAGHTYESLARQLGVNRSAPFYWEHVRGDGLEAKKYRPAPIGDDLYAKALVVLGFVPPPHLPARTRGEK